MVGTPAYRRIYEDLATRIRSGELAPESQLLGEAILAEQYGVARMTVRQAIGQLADDALVIRRQGVGTFVARDAGSRRSLNRLTSFTEDMAGTSRKVETTVIAREVIDPPEDIADELGIAEGARVVRVKRLRRVNGVPALLNDSHLPYGLFPSLDHEELVGGSLYRTLEERYDVRLRRADQRIRAVAAPKDVARLLEVPSRSPLLRSERITMDERNVRVEFARSWARPDFELSVHLQR